MSPAETAPMPTQPSIEAPSPSSPPSGARLLAALAAAFGLWGAAVAARFSPLSAAGVHSLGAAGPNNLYGILGAAAALAGLWLALGRSSIRTRLLTAAGLAASLLVLSSSFEAAFFVLWVQAAACGLGLKLLKRLAPEQRFSKHEEILWAVVLGMGALSFGVLGIGLMGMLVRPVLFLGLAGLSAWVLPELKGAAAWWQTTGEPLPEGERAPVWEAAVFALGVFSFIGALAPELTYDAVISHLALPRYYLAHHETLAEGVTFGHANPQYIPQNMQMIYTLLMSLGGLGAAKLSAWLPVFWTGFAVYAWARQERGAEAGWLAAALFACVPLTLHLSTTAMVDLPSMLPFVLAAWAACRYFDRPEEGRQLLRLCGIGLGLAYGTSPNAGLGLPAVLAALVAARLLRSKGMESVEAVKDAFEVGWTFLAATAVWVIKARAQTGNPVYPMLNGFFKSPKLPPDMQNFNWSIFGMGHGPKAYLLLPWNMTFHTSAFVEAPDGSGGMAFLALLPLLAWWAFRPARLRKGRDAAGALFLPLFCAIFAAGVALFVQYLRYMGPIFPVVAVLSALACVDLRDALPNKAWKTAFMALPLASVVLSAAAAPPSFWAVPEKLAYRVALGLQSHEEFLRERVLPFGAIEAVNADAGPDGRVLLCSNIPVHAYSALPVDFVGPQFLGAKDAAALHQALLAGGYTHVILDPNTSAPATLDSPLFQEEFRRRYLIPLGAANNVGAYAVRREPLVGEPELPELIANSGFEELVSGAPKGWTASGDAQADATGPAAHGGKTAVRTAASPASWTQAVSLRSMRTYELAAWVRSEVPGSLARLQLNWMDAKGAFLGVNIAVLPASPEYRRRWMLVQAPKGAAGAVIYATAHVGRIWYDDVSLTEARDR